MIAAEIGAGIAEAAEDCDHACGALEACGLAFVGGLRFDFYLLEQFWGNPAAWGLAFRHFFGGFGVEDVDAAQERGPQVAIIEIAL